MSPDRAVVVATVVILLGVTAASGPPVGLTLTQSETFSPGTGSADIAVESTPETATLSKADHGAGTYHLRLSAVELTAVNTTGQPTLTYQLSVPELSHSTASITFLDSDDTGRINVGFEPSLVEAEKVDSEYYDGTIRVSIADDDGSRLLVENDVRIEVEE